MTTECIQDSLDFGTVEGRRVVGTFDGGAVTSDGVALLLGATDKAIRLVERFAACFSGYRAPEMIEHTSRCSSARACSAWRSATRTSTIMTPCATIRCWRH